MENSIIGKIATNTSNIVNTPPFLTANYWFGTPDSFDFNKVFPLAILSSLLIIFPIVIFAVKMLNSKLDPPEQKFLTKIIVWTGAFGPIGWLLILFRNQGVVFLSARFWWVLWFISLFLVLVSLYRYRRQKLPLLVAQYQTYKVKKKYFPRVKKKVKR